MTQCQEETTRRIALRSLASPWSITAIVVLIVNDHLLKAWLSGWLTGKLSDFAGLVFFPLLVAAAVSSRRPGTSRSPLWAGVALTGVFFSVINLFPRAATVTERAMAGLGVPWQITVDPSDLLALPMLLVPVAIWRHSESTARRPARKRFEFAVLLVAAAASMATSCGDAYPAVWAVEADGRALVAYTDIGVYRSDDGGESWVEQTVEREDLPSKSESQTTACVEDDPDRCFRLISPLTVEETGADGEWRTAFHISPERVDYMQRSFSGGCSDYIVDVTDMAISDGPDPIVVIAAADAGLLLRRSDGAWERGVLPRWTVAPVADIGRGPSFEISASWGIALLSAMIVASVAARRMVPGHGTRDGFWWGAARLMGLFGAGGVALLGSGFPGSLIGGFLAVGMLPALAGFARLVSWLGDEVGRRNRPLRFMSIALIPLGGALVSYLIWLLWRASAIESYAVAQPLANLILGIASVGAIGAALFLEPPVMLTSERLEEPAAAATPPSRDQVGAVSPEFWRGTLVGCMGTIAAVVSIHSSLGSVLGVAAGLVAVTALIHLAMGSGLSMRSRALLVVLPAVLTLVTVALGLGPDPLFLSLLSYPVSAAWMVPAKRRGIPRRLRRMGIFLLSLPFAYAISAWLLITDGGAIYPMAFLAAVVFAEDRPSRPRPG